MSLARVRLRSRKKHRRCGDDDKPTFVKNAIAHCERPHCPNPNLSWFLLQVNQWLAKLRIDTKPAVEFPQSRYELLSISPLPGNLRHGAQTLPHSF